MKRILCLALALLLLFTACGPTADGDETTTTTESATASTDDNATTGEGFSTEQTNGTGGSSGITDASGTSTGSTTTSTTVGGNKDATTGTTTGTSAAPTTTGGNSSVSQYDNDYFRLGNGLANTYLRLKNEKKLTVAFMGGSVTYGTSCDDPETNAFRSLVVAWLKQQFPDAQITQVNAAYPSACSAYGVYAVDEKVIDQGADLVFVEYAINDRYARSYYDLNSSKANYETILRKLRQADPTCDVVALYVTNKGNDYIDYMNGQEAVAQHYGIPSIDIGNYLRDKTGMTTAANSTAFTNLWNTYFADSAHANVAGHAKYGEILIESLEKAFTAAKEAGVTAITKKTMPTAQNIGLMMNTAYIDADEIPAATGWTLTGSGRFKNLVANAEFTYTFTGTGISLFLQAASGTSFQYAVDGGTMQTVSIASGNTYHLPLPVVEGLTSGQHTITFKVPTAGTMKISAILVCK